MRLEPPDAIQLRLPRARTEPSKTISTTSEWEEIASALRIPSRSRVLACVAETGGVSQQNRHTI